VRADARMRACVRVEYDSAVPGPPHVWGLARGNGVLFWYNKEDRAHGVVEASQIVSSDRQRARARARALPNKDGSRGGRQGGGRGGPRVARVAETLLLNE